METLKQGILCYVSNLIFFWFSSLTYTTRVTTIESTSSTLSYSGQERSLGKEKLYAAQEKPIAKGIERGIFHRTWCLVRQVPPGEAYGAHQDLLHPCQHPQAHSRM